MFTIPVAFFVLFLFSAGDIFPFASFKNFLTFHQLFGSLIDLSATLVEHIK